MSWLTRLFCKHKWQVLRNGVITQYGAQIGTWYDCRCEHCGTVKRFNLL